MKKFIYIGLLLMNSALIAGEVGTLNTFTSGTQAKASEVNENFSAVKNAVNNNAANITQLFSSALSIITTTKPTSSFDLNPSTIFVSEVAAASCLTDELLVGGSCSCNSNNFDSSTTNFGMVMFCSAVGNSYIGACATPLSDANLLKAGSPITVTAICLGAIQADGTNFKRILTTNERKPDAEAQATIDEYKELQATTESINLSRTLGQ